MKNTCLTFLRGPAFSQVSDLIGLRDMNVYCEARSNWGTCEKAGSAKKAGQAFFNVQLFSWIQLFHKCLNLIRLRNIYMAKSNQIIHFLKTLDNSKSWTV